MTKVFQMVTKLYALNCCYQALMKFTKRSMENLFANARKVSFRSGAHAFIHSRNSLKMSDVIVGCPFGMKYDEICGE